MGYLNFKNNKTEEIFRRFKWTRNNTIQIFETALANNVLDNSLSVNSKFQFQKILFQFQCIITTTDTYKRKSINHKNKDFGILVTKDKIIKKSKIQCDDILSLLRNQIKDVEEAFKTQELDNIIELIKIIDHEHLHQGELILMLRANNVDLPKRFIKSWNL